MNRKPLVLIALLLILGGGATFYYHELPQSQVKRTLERFLDTIEHQKISLRKPSDTAQALELTLADSIALKGEFPIPSEKMTRKDLIKTVQDFHQLTTLCEISQRQFDLQIIGSQAIATLTANILVAAGQNNRDQQAWKITFDLEKSDRWRIVGIRGSQL